MKVSLIDAGKRYNREWIFRHFTYNFEAGKSYAITGANGSGKSTLLMAISGSMHLNEGRVEYHTGPAYLYREGETGKQTSTEGRFPDELIYSQVSICAPYLELVEEMTLAEFLKFHGGFKPFREGLTPDSIIATLGLENAAHKQLRYFSSGMKQRVKLAQCIFSDTPVLLLDEPSTNLDTAGINLYHSLIRDHCSKKLVIVSSNDPMEYEFCQEKISLSDYK